MGISLQWTPSCRPALKVCSSRRHRRFGTNSECCDPVCLLYAGYFCVRMSARVQTQDQHLITNTMTLPPALAPKRSLRGLPFIRKIIRFPSNKSRKPHCSPEHGSVGRKLRGYSESQCSTTRYPATSHGTRSAGCSRKRPAALQQQHACMLGFSHPQDAPTGSGAAAVFVCAGESNPKGLFRATNVIHYTLCTDASDVGWGAQLSL